MSDKQKEWKKVLEKIEKSAERDNKILKKMFIEMEQEKQINMAEFAKTLITRPVTNNFLSFISSVYTADNNNKKMHFCRN